MEYDGSDKEVPSEEGRFDSKGLSTCKMRRGSPMIIRKEVEICGNWRWWLRTYVVMSKGVKREELIGS